MTKMNHMIPSKTSSNASPFVLVLLSISSAREVLLARQLKIILSAGLSFHKGLDLSITKKEEVSLHPCPKVYECHGSGWWIYCLEKIESFLLYHSRCCRVGESPTMVFGWNLCSQEPVWQDRTQESLSWLSWKVKFKVKKHSLFSWILLSPSSLVISCLPDLE